MCVVFLIKIKVFYKTNAFGDCIIHNLIKQKVRSKARQLFLRLIKS